VKLSRRGLFGWLGALTGAAAVAKVAPALAEPRPEFKHVATNPELLRTPEDVLEMMRRDAYPRRSGRTTRALLDALDIAKTGKNVLFVVAHTQFCDEAMRLLVKHAKADLGAARGNGRGYCVNVLPAGVIDIVAAHRATPQALRGSSATVIRDHLCYEMGV
jgi:hypothetical protein